MTGNGLELLNCKLRLSIKHVSQQIGAAGLLHASTSGFSMKKRSCSALNRRSFQSGEATIVLVGWRLRLKIWEL